MNLITPEQWTFFDEQGYLKLGRLLEADELAALQRRIDDIMVGRAELDYSRVLMQLDMSKAKAEVFNPSVPSRWQGLQRVFGMFGS